MTDRLSASDREVIERIRAGDSRTLEDLLAAYWAPLVQYASGIIGSADEAQDVVQEAFVRLWAKRERWSAEGSVRALLYTVTRNAALDERRRVARRLKLGREAPAPEPESSPAADLAADELRVAAQRAVERLPPKRREVFRLAREQGLSHKEIAQVLDLSAQTVANHLSLALTDLRAELAPFLVEEGRAP